MVLGGYVGAMRNHHVLLAAALLLVPLAGCIDGAQGAPEGAVAFETIDRGPNSGIEEERTVVVRDQAAFEDLWAEHQANRSGEPDMPGVDFDEQVVAAIFKGESPDGCHGAQIENVTGDGDQITVSGAFFEVTDAYCTQQITHPFHIVAFDRYDAETTFAIREETRQQGNGTDGDNGTDEGAADQGSYTCREPGPADASTTGANVTFATIEGGEQSGIEQPCVTVARNETAWRDLWRDHYPTSTADDERPEVDFDESIVAAIFKGESPDACHGAEVEEVTPEGQDLVVHGVFYVVEDQACAEVVTYPYHIVELERPEGGLVFDVREETRQG
jgi:hypothetical protein